MSKTRDRIRKLLRLAASAEGNEAAVAMRMASKLMRNSGLKLELIDCPSTWHASLLAMLTPLHDCQSFVEDGATWAVGEQHDIDTLVLAYDYLARFVGLFVVGQPPDKRSAYQDASVDILAWMVQDPSYGEEDCYLDALEESDDVEEDFEDEMPPVPEDWDGTGDVDFEIVTDGRDLLNDWEVYSLTRKLRSILETPSPMLVIRARSELEYKYPFRRRFPTFARVGFRYFDY